MKQFLLNLLNMKSKGEKEKTFTKSQVLSVLKIALDCSKETPVDWDEVDYEVELDWDNRILISNIDPSYQLAEIFDVFVDTFIESLDDPNIIKDDKK